MKNLIYIVEDEGTLQKLYKMILDESEYDVVLFSTAEEFFEALKEKKCDLVIMDLMLPGIDGLEAIQNMRKNREFSEIPCIIVSAKGEEQSLVSGLDIGADDYMHKPFSAEELKARIKANIRKNTLRYMSDNEIYYDIKSNSIFCKNQKLDLTIMEKKLLLYFVNHPNRTIAREELFKQLWDSNYMGKTRTLDMHVSKLRTILSKYTKIEHIITSRGEGYKFIN